MLVVKSWQCCLHVCVLVCECWLVFACAAAFMVVSGKAKVMCGFPTHKKPNYDTLVCSSIVCIADDW